MGFTPDSTTGKKGRIKLAGDLGGTADSPTTPTAIHLTGNETIDGTKVFLDGLNVGEGAVSDSAGVGGIDAPFGTVAGNNAVMRIVAFHGTQQYVSKRGPAMWYISDTSGNNETNVMNAEYDQLNMNSHKITSLANGTNSTDAVNKGQLDTAVAAGSPVSEVTGTSQAMAARTRYIANNAALVTFTLPTTAALGDQFIVRGKGAGLWKIAQNASQTIHGATDTTTGTGGSLTAQTRYDCVTLECITANTDFLIINQRGTLTSV